ncbi:MAG: hypothetical protein WD846_03985 [Patescibacteria group bacterium]
MSFLSIRNLAVVTAVQTLDCPLPKFRGNRDTAEFLVDLLLKLSVPQESTLSAIHVFLLAGAMVIGVQANLSGFLYDFSLCLSRVKTTAFGATDQTCEREKILLWARATVPAEQKLNLIVFFLGDHRLMLSLIPLTAPFGVLELAVVEGVGENFVNRALGERPAAKPLHLPCAKPPFVRCDFQDAWWRIRAGKHQFPHLSD